MAYRPDIDISSPVSPVVGTITRDTSGVLDTVRRGIAERGTGLAPVSGMGYNPNTREFAVGDKVIGRMGLSQLESVIPRVREASRSGLPIPPLPAGFQEVNVDRFEGILRAARSDPTADLGTFVPNAKQAAGGIVSAVGTALGDKDIVNPFAGDVAQHQLDAPWDQQASYDESPFTSLAGLGTNLATAGGQVAPTLAAGLATGGVGAIATGALTAAGQQGDAGMATLLDAIDGMSEADLRESSPVYAAARGAGKTHEQAVDSMINTARGYGAAVGAVEGTIGAILGTKLLGTVWSRFASQAPGLGAFNPLKSESLVKRMLGASAIGGVSEGGGAIAGDLAVNERARDVAGKDASYGLGDALQSFQEEAPLGFVLGALGGVRGAPVAVKQKNDTVNSDEAAALTGVVAPPSTGIIPRPDPGFTLGARTDPQYTGPLPGDYVDSTFEDVTPGTQLLLPPPAPTRAPDYAPGQGPIPERSRGQQDLFDVRTGEPTNVGPAQGELALPGGSAVTPPLSYSDISNQQPLPLPAAPPVQQELALPTPVESVRVATYFNNTILPIIRRAEDDAGLATGNNEEVTPAEALSAEQAISSVRAAQKAGLLNKGVANTFVGQIRQRAAQDLKKPMPRPVAPAATAPAEAPSPAPTPSGDVTSETPVVPTAAAVASSKGQAAVAAAQTRERKIPNKNPRTAGIIVTEPVPAPEPAPAPSGRAGRTARETALRRAVRTVQGKDVAVADLEAAASAPLTVSTMRRTVRDIDLEEKRAAKAAAVAARTKKIADIANKRQTTTPLVARVIGLVNNGEVTLGDLKRHLKGLRALELYADQIDEAASVRAVVDEVEDAVEDSQAAIELVEGAVRAVQKTPAGRTKIEEARAKNEGKKGRPKPLENTGDSSKTDSPSSTRSKPSASTTATAGKSKPRTSPGTSPTVVKSRSPRSLRAAGRDGASRAAVLQPEAARLARALGKYVPTVKVVQSLEDVPELDRVGAGTDTRGIYSRDAGTVYIIADNVGVGGVGRVLNHEIIGHFGLDQILTPKQWDSILAEIDNLRLDPRFRSYFQTLERAYPGADRNLLAQEFIARAAELQPESNIVRRVVSMVRAFFARIGMTAEYQATLEDMPSAIRQSLRDSAKYLKDGLPAQEQVVRDAQERALYDTGERVADNKAWQGIKAASKRAGRSRAADILKDWTMRAATLRNLEGLYADARTAWGVAYKRMVDLQFIKNRQVQERLGKTAHIMSRVNDLAPASRAAMQELMLWVNYNGGVNPYISYEDNAKFMGDNDTTRRVYNEAVEKFRALPDDATRRSFQELAEADQVIYLDLMASRKQHYEKLSGKTPEEGGIDKKTADDLVTEMKEEVAAAKQGRINFSLQREGDWFVSVQQAPVTVSNHATKKEANEASGRRDNLNPFTKVTVRQVADGTWDVEVATPLYRAFDSEQQALDAMPDIEEAIREQYVDYYRRIMPDNETEAARQAAEDFREVWKESFVPLDGDPTNPVEIDKVVPTKKTQLYNTELGVQYAPEMVKKLAALQRRLPENVYNELIADYLRMADKSAYSRAKLTRRLVAGADAKNMVDAFVRRYVATAHALVNSDYSFEEGAVRAELNDRGSQRRYNATTGRRAERGLDQLFRNIEATATTMKDSPMNKTMTALRGVTTMLNLGFSPSFWMLNATQPHVVGVPYLAAQTIGGHQVTGAEAAAAVSEGMFNAKNWKRTFDAVVDALVADSKGLVGKAVDKEQWSETTINGLMDLFASDLKAGSKQEFIDILKEIDKQDGLALTYTDALYDAMNSSKAMDKAAKLQRIAMSGAKLTEVMNRFTMARAAYTLASKHGLDGNARVDFINKAIYKTQGDFSRTNRAEIFNHPMIGTALTFKTYLQMMAALFIEAGYKATKGQSAADRREGRRLLAGLFLTHFTAAGVTGLGMFGTAAKFGLVMLAFGQGDDDEHYLKNDMDIDTQFRKGVRELFGDKEGDDILTAVAQDGIPAAFGVNVSSRLQIPSAWDTRYIRVDKNNETSSWLNGFIAQTVGGAPYSTVQRLVQGGVNIWSGAADGDTREVRQGIEKLLPQLFADAMKTYDRSDRGVIDTAGREIVPQSAVSASDLFWTLLGFTPQGESIARNRRSDFFDVKNDGDRRRNELLRDYQRAKGADKVRALRNIQEFNARMPADLRITPASLQRSTQSTQSSVGNNRRDAAYEAMLQ